MSHRASHYFVCYAAQATAVAAGMGGTRTTEASNSKNGKDEHSWSLTVTQPLHMEIPRSLQEVAKAWNIPMHQWLKKCKCCLFNVVRRPC